MFRLHNFRLFLGRPTSLLPLGLYSKAIFGIRNIVLLWSVWVFIFVCGVTSPSAQPPTWTTKVGLSFFALPIILSLFDKGDTTRSLSSSRLSPQRHLFTQTSLTTARWWYRRGRVSSSSSSSSSNVSVIEQFRIIYLPMILLLLLFVITFMQDINKYMCETNRASSVLTLQLCCSYRVCYM